MATDFLVSQSREYLKYIAFEWDKSTTTTNSNAKWDKESPSSAICHTCVSRCTQYIHM